MNKYRIERIEMIVAMIMNITGLPENIVLRLIKNTATYKNIIKGDECTLYEDYSANVMDIAKEIESHQVAKKITPDAVSDLNQWMFENDIENARQLKEKSIVKDGMLHATVIAISDNDKNTIAARKQLKLFELKRNVAAKSIHSKSIHSKRVDGLSIPEPLKNKKEYTNKVKKGKKV